MLLSIFSVLLFWYEWGSGYLRKKRVAIVTTARSGLLLRTRGGEGGGIEGKLSTPQTLTFLKEEIMSIGNINIVT